MEEYLRLLQAGEQPDREAFLARYPEVAAALAACLQGLDFVHAAGAQLSQPAENLLPEGPAANPTPEALGDFCLLREVGSGGMGIVYEAEQRSLGRRVALKVLPFAGALDARQLQRFRLEAQAAAQLHHTNIVPVYAVGNERGVHFYAMQFIEGQSLAQVIAALRLQLLEVQDAAAERTSDVKPPPKVDQSRSAVGNPTVLALSTERSITSRDFFRNVANLGIQAAEALDYAHQQGIVHRDVKPANLLVEAPNRLWLTDFGLAQVQSDVRLTRTGDLVGTLRYMSPEQSLAKRGVVDHRADIYSLGATLYEMLTLEPTFPETDRQELLRLIAVEEPRPPRRLNKAIPEELEIIVLKALEKDPGERYATAQELADDLRRFLLHEPIRAKKPTWVQRASKWFRRHPAVVRSAVLMLVLLTAGSSLSTWLVWQERTRTGEALAATVTERNRADEEKRIAQEREAETKAVLEFVESKILAATRPQGQEGGLGHEVTLRRALEAALPSVAKNFSSQPLIEARLRRTLGLSFRYLGEEAIAAEQFLAARTLYTKERGPDDPGALASSNNLANSYAALGRHTEALQLREETLALRRATLGPDHADTLASMNNLATSYDALGRHSEALQLREETLTLRKAKLGPDHPDTLASMNNLGISYTVLGRHAEAVRLREATLALLKARSAPDYPRLLASMHNLAESYHALGQHAEALQLYTETLVLAQAKLPQNHPKTLLIMNNLAWLLATAADVRFRDPARAVELAAKAAELSPNTADFWGTLGSARYRTGDAQQASLDLERAISLRSPDDSRNANESFFLAMARWQLGDKLRAQEWFDKGMAWMNKVESRDDEVHRFRVEAAHLLGIRDEAARPDQQTSR